jgi:hypothetical protein
MNYVTCRFSNRDEFFCVHLFYKHSGRTFSPDQIILSAKQNMFKPSLQNVVANYLLNYFANIGNV